MMATVSALIRSLQPSVVERPTSLAAGAAYGGRSATSDTAAEYRSASGRRQFDGHTHGCPETNAVSGHRSIDDETGHLSSGSAMSTTASPSVPMKSASPV